MRRLVLGLVIGSAAACGSFGSDVAPGPDASTSSPSDAGADAVARDANGSVKCPIGGAFGAGTKVALTGDYSIEGARFSPEEATAYLALCPAAPVDKTKCELYTASFLPASQAFGNLVRMVGVSAANTYDSYPTATPAGDFMLFGSGREGDVHVFVAAAKNGSFDAPTITRLAVEPDDFGNEPYLLGDGKTLYFSAAKKSDYRSHLYRAAGAPPGFGPAEVVAGVADPSNANKLAPVVTDDELEIFYASDIGNIESQTGLDIYTATRTATGQPFENPHKVDVLSSSAGNDWPTWISPDGCRLYTIRKDAGGVASLYVSTR